MADTYYPINRGRRRTHTDVDQFRQVDVGIMNGQPRTHILDNGTENWTETLQNTDPTNGRVLRILRPDNSVGLSYDINGLNVAGDLTIGGSFIQAGGPVFNVEAFGADPSGILPSDTAIADAIAAMPSQGGQLYFPAGHYYIQGPIVIAKAMLIYGDGRNVSVIQSTATDTSIFTVTVVYPNGQVIFRDLGMTRVNVPTTLGGAAIMFAVPNTATDSVWHPVIERCSFFFHFNAVTAVNCGHLRLLECDFANNYSASLLMTNLIVPGGGGDHFIRGNVFTNSDAAGTVAILITSGAGWDIGDNKFLGYERQIFLRLDATATNNSDLWIHDNSMEGGLGTLNCIAIDDNGRPMFENVMIVDNELALGNTAVASACVAIGGSAGVIRMVQIQNNEIHALSSFVTAISIGSGHDMVIEGNQISLLGGATAFVNIGGTNLRRGLNDVIGTGTLQSGTWAFIQPKIQYKQVAMTATNAAAGALFSGPASAAQAWPEAFRVAPHTILTQAITAGGVNAIIDSSSATQFTAHAQGVANGVAYTFQFVAMSDG